MRTRKTVGLKNHKGGRFEFDESFMRMVIRDYESGDLSLKQVGLKYGLDRRKVFAWKKLFGSDIEAPKAALVMSPEEQQQQEALKKQVEQLKKELEHLKMKEFALNTMIDIAKEKYNVDLRKKNGTKQSEE